MHNAVETTHYNLTSVVMQVIACEPSMYTDQEKWLAILPMFHMYGALCYMFLSRKSLFFNLLYLLNDCKAFCHATTYILPKFEPELWLKSIQKYRITASHYMYNSSV
jgi:4-coumarate--CoA ligase